MWIQSKELTSILWEDKNSLDSMWCSDHLNVKIINILKQVYIHHPLWQGLNSIIRLEYILGRCDSPLVSWFWQCVCQIFATLLRDVSIFACHRLESSTNLEVLCCLLTGKHFPPSEFQFVSNKISIFRSNPFLLMLTLKRPIWKKVPTYQLWMFKLKIVYVFATSLFLLSNLNIRISHSS